MKDHEDQPWHGDLFHRNPNSIAQCEVLRTVKSCTQRANATLRGNRPHSELAVRTNSPSSHNRGHTNEVTLPQKSSRTEQVCELGSGERKCESSRTEQLCELTHL